MAKNGGNITPNQDKYNKMDLELFEFEDFGGPSLVLWSIIIVVLMLILVASFAMLVATGAIAISEVING